MSKLSKRKSEVFSEHDYSDRSEYNNNFDIPIALPTDLPKQAKLEIKKSILRKSMKLNSKMVQMSEDLHLVGAEEKERV